MTTVQVFAEAGIDLGAMAAAGGGAGAGLGVGPGAASSPAGPVAAPAAEPGKLWTPGSQPPSGGGDEKPAIWTP